MKGLNTKIDMSVLKRIDDIFVELFKIVPEEEETAKVGEETEKKPPQHHVVHMLSLALKTKMSAKFNLNYPQKVEF